MELKPKRWIKNYPKNTELISFIVTSNRRHSLIGTTPILPAGNVGLTRVSGFIRNSMLILRLNYFVCFHKIVSGNASLRADCP